MPARHSLVWLSADGWQRAAQTAAAGNRAILERWQSRDWPAVLRRRQPDTPEDQLCLGLALPPDANGDKGRIPFLAQFGDVQRITDPLALRAALPQAPPAWSRALNAFAGDCLHSGIAMRIYGSWAWQILTQQSYLTRTSDIDLLFTPGSAEELRRGIALLAQHAARLPLDGEVVFADGQAVAWKECWQALQGDGGQQVLVKARSTVRLAPMAGLVATLEGA
ncbi:malonate decarboxylase holo-[acyl-carrier-protein] synthase [Collimonas fungivorans]|jgi:phosphoribosyl-dephospho-CoA transferase|uniref:Malonate decarboxylase holo-[acyl-carrier-protein] synthase n=1 Tax=Collimonas fungivorans TaxID=158899 RepID=A0A127PAI6_9BURK|nr:malonate decarboxylase holo-[acyl-carrier-protein] synthase [Collimonas fungivorans]AMO94816.1 malonate decarboxylase holo-[acyl-carrier-protein] synthase [Collimonas fungivorans]